MVSIDSDPRPHVLLAWEGGAGRGHLVTLKTVALALGSDAICDAALCDMTHAAEIKPYVELAFPGALLPYNREVRKAPGVPRTASWGEFMGDLGFRDAAFVRQQVEWWLAVMEARLTDLVVGDYSPCALLAARIAGIPTVAIGTGYGIPPAGLTHFPDFLPEYHEHIYSEAAMVDTINDALGPLGLPVLSHLPDVYHRSGDLVRTLSMLDPYDHMRDAPLLPPVADVGDIANEDADEIFVYFSTTELGYDDVVDALINCPHPIRAFLPGADDDLRQRLHSAGVVVETQPVPVNDIARRTALIVNSGQHGILSLALAAGIAQLCLPQHLEQLYHARRAEEAGVAMVLQKTEGSYAHLGDALRSAYADITMRRRARGLAKELRPFFAQDATAMIRERLMPLVR